MTPRGGCKCIEIGCDEVQEASAGGAPKRSDKNVMTATASCCHVRDV